MAPPRRTEPQLSIGGGSLIIGEVTELYSKQAKKGNKIKKVIEKDVINVNANSRGSRGDSRLPSLKDTIESSLAEVAPTEESLARADRCLLGLRSMLSGLGAHWDVQSFGSYANGFATLGSDLDVTCCIPGSMSKEEAQDRARSDLKLQILPMLQRHSAFTILEEVLHARIPILKLRFENMLDVDLSCHNPAPLRNTRLLKAYSSLDPRIRDLGIAIKLWGKRAGVCDATKANLSSYAFTLLLVYFMQVHADLQLPVLPVHLFESGISKEADEALEDAKRTWKCRLTILEMMARFFAFYAGGDSDSFLWGSEVVSIRRGCRLATSDASFLWLRGRHTHRLHIEDPYQLERNLHCVLGEAEEDQLRSCFKEAKGDIDSIGVPRTVLTGQAAVELHQCNQPSAERDSAAIPIVSNPPSAQKEPEGENFFDLVDMMRGCKTEHTVGSCADSTKSGGTIQTLCSSDDDSCAESSAPHIVGIPWPNSLFTSSSKENMVMKSYINPIDRFQ
jgi:hypothetical protein